MIANVAPEILQCIAAQVHSIADLNALTQTCTKAHGLLNSYLYRRDAQQNDGGKALLRAARQGIEATAKKSLAAHRVVSPGGKIQIMAEKALLAAARSGQPAIVRLALAVPDVNPDATPDSLSSSETSLMLAAEGGHDEVLDLLLATQRVDINARDKWGGHRPLLLATTVANEAIVRRLLDLPGIDPHVCDDHGHTALALAARTGLHEVVELLLTTHGVNADPKSEFGATPLMEAAAKGKERVIDVLLRTGKVDVDGTDDDAQSALTMAAMMGYGGVVQQLLSAGATADAKDFWGRTPFLHAVLEGSTEVMEILINSGKVDVNSRDNDGRTPLSRAAEDGLYEVVGVLLAVGADRTIADDEGMLPADRAEYFGNEIVADLIRDYSPPEDQEDAKKAVDEG